MKLDRLVVGLLLFVSGVFLVVGVTVFGMSLVTVWTVAGGLVVVAGAYWVMVHGLPKQSAARMEARIVVPMKDETNASAEPTTASSSTKAQQAALRQRLRDAIRTIRTSHLGDKRGREALYDLPWYMLIGTSAAGKTSAVTRAGLRFPLDDGKGRAVKGDGGTRDCDWYFTSEGILLDTAGRYAGDPGQHGPWLAFLDLLRRYRRRAPINGLIVTVSIEQIAKAGESVDEDAIVALATTLRQRMHEISERLRVSVPVYVLFTKADRIPGFSDYFGEFDEVERRQIWGGTLPFDADGTADAAAQFIDHLDELVQRLRRGAFDRIAAGLADVSVDSFTLPGELARRKAPMARFLEVLFESNPYHGRAVFRGFYLTSAMPASSPVSDDRRDYERSFTFPHSKQREAPAGFAEGGSFFLHDVFREVIFADDALVRQQLPRRARRQRRAVLWAACVVTSAGLAWASYSYRASVQLIRHVEADYAQVEQMTAERVDLQSRLDALLILQDRLTQLLAYREDTPWSLWPVYDTELLLAPVRHQYFEGMRQVMVDPAAAELARYLEAVTTPTASADATPANDGSPYAAPAPGDRQSAYAALKAYLMLADPERAEAAHLATEVARFWRVWLEANRGDMTREAMVERADRLLRFHTALAGEPEWPRIQPRAALVDDARRVLSEAMRGTPARDRVYAGIVARAASRYPAVTVRDIVGADAPTLAGSYAIPGAYSLAAWQGYVREAIGDASRKALDTSDWVLRSTQVDDLTLSGSPEHIRKDLEDEYARRYIAEWQRFLAGVTVADFTDFAGAAAAIDRLGDAERSPLRALLQRARRETAWDEVPLPDKADAKAAAVANAARGPVSQAFAGLARLVDARDGAPAPLDAYLAQLGTLRSRLHAIANEGDVGPGARRFLEATLQGKDSELVAALRHTDEHMLTGLPDAQRQALRPLLLRPLMQTFAALVGPVEVELNRVWAAQVLRPFREELAGKYPFDEGGRVEAAPDEVARLFGPSGAIARFASDTLGPLVERRGDILTPRRWGEQAVTLSPELLAAFPRWVSPDGSGAAGPHTVFQLMPEPTGTGIAQVTVTIAGQSLRYGHEAPQWRNFVWGGVQSDSARIDAITTDGRGVQVAAFEGADALGELVGAARRERGDDGTHVLAWTNDGTTVALRLRIISAARVDADGQGKPGLRGVQLPERIAGAVAEVAP
jgi:type VI secretion system protein ImpL